MSKYTTELRYIVESGYRLTALENYPIFDEDYREKLNQDILNHFWFREIGFETVGVFNHYLGATLNEIMPYYNKLFKANLLEINPLSNHGFTEVYSGSSSGNSESASTSKNKGIDSKPADGLLSVDDIEKNVYANNATFTDSSLSGTSSSGGASEYSKKVTGLLNVSEAELLSRYTKSVYSVTQKLLKDKELNKCFMGVY